MDNNSQLAQPSQITQHRPAVGQVGQGGPSVPPPANGGSGGFQASEIKPLDYNLRPYVEASGTVPEPTRARQAEFTKRMTKLANTTNLPEIRNLSPEEQEKAIQDDPGLIDRMLELGDEAESELREAVANLCGGSEGQPTREELDALPPRIFTAFYRWILAETTPEM